MGMRPILKMEEMNRIHIKKLCVCLQWEIYDTYVEELQKQEKSKEKQKTLLSRKEEDKGKKKTALVENQVGALSHLCSSKHSFSH